LFRFPGSSADAFLACLSFGMIIRAAANAILCQALSLRDNHKKSSLGLPIFTQNSKTQNSKTHRGHKQHMV
jgi:hypothetical protein